MILTMDIGNTNVKIGIFKNDKLTSTWRVSTVASHTADEYGMVIYDLLRQTGDKFEDIKGTVMSSVAPMLNYTIEHMLLHYTGKKPLVVDSKTKTGIKICYDNPRELGADRIVACSAAHYFYGGPAIVVDFGSATTFNLVTADGVFLGGAIAPGIKTATESLVNTAAKLPRIELSVPESIVGTSTKTCMQAGIIFGNAGLVKYMIEKYKQMPQMKDAKVIVTGGLSELISKAEPSMIDYTDRALALKGLKYIYDINNTK